MPVKSKKLSIRISESNKQILNRAANIKGINLTSFVLQTAMDEATKTLSHEKRIELTKKDMKRLLEVIDSTDSNKNLSDAFALYNEVIR
jgi:uncharacterized protein (DUF1778 family)